MYVAVAVAIAGAICIVAIFRPVVHAHLVNLSQPNPGADGNNISADFYRPAWQPRYF